MDHKHYFELILDNVSKLHDKVEKIEDTQDDMGKTLIRNTASLEEHVRRTNLLENKFERFENNQLAHAEQDTREHKELADRVNALETPRKALTWLKNAVIGLGATSGAIWAILRLLGKV